jgi:hypothetical protein
VETPAHQVAEAHSNLAPVFVSASAGSDATAALPPHLAKLLHRQGGQTKAGAARAASPNVTRYVENRSRSKQGSKNAVTARTQLKGAVRSVASALRLSRAHLRQGVSPVAVLQVSSAMITGCPAAPLAPPPPRLPALGPPLRQTR